jgi:hypothetical protein
VVSWADEQKDIYGTHVLYLRDSSSNAIPVHGRFMLPPQSTHEEPSQVRLARSHEGLPASLQHDWRRSPQATTHTSFLRVRYGAQGSASPARRTLQYQLGLSESHLR